MKDEYVSYNALARKSLVWGVPLLLGLALLAIFIVSVFISVLLKSMLFAIIPMSIAILTLVIKFISESDSMATDKAIWAIKGFMLRIKHLSFKQLTVSSQVGNAKKRERINDFFKRYRVK